MSYRLSQNTCTSVNTEIGRGYTGISVKTSKSTSSWSLFVRDQKPVALLLQKKRFPLMPANSAKRAIVVWLLELFPIEFNKNV